MAGVVLETVSNRKLIAFGITLLLLQVAAYLLGGLIAPAPASTITTLATKCVDKNRSSTKWHVPWPNASRCDNIQTFDSPEDIVRIEKDEISANDIVFAFKFPLPRDGAELHMSRWFQSIIGILQVDSEFSDNMGTSLAEGVDMKLDVRLGYRSASGDDEHWTEIARSDEIRQLRCNASEVKDRIPMMCDFLPMFELGSCHYDFYLVNIRLPINTEQDYNFNTGIGHIMDLWLTIIHWNGGFNKVWFSLKTVFFPLVVGALVWHCKRVSEQLRPPTLLERTLVSLGVAMSVLNAPIEWLTLFIDMPYMSLIGDIRQGLFYSVLLCFWVIFAGEHMMDQVERNKVTWYWKHLTAVGFACICLFVFEMCEKGVQLTNPFYSIWATPVGTKLALTFVVLAGFAACVYFFFLCYMLFRVFRNIHAKKSALPHMNQRRRKFFINVIYRFKFLIVLTAVCAALTVIFFIIGQVSDSEHKWGEPNYLQYRSAFLTGVYAMWNLYVFGLLVLYAPSNKRFLADDADEGPNNSDEQVQLSSVPSDAPLAAVPSEVSALAGFIQKASTD